MAQKPLNQSPRYCKFVTERDQALEAILDKYLRAQDRLLTFLRTQIVTVATHMGYRGISVEHKRQALATFEARISPYFALCQNESIKLMTEMRSTVFTLALSGEAEAIARALGKPGKYSIHKDALAKIHAKDTPSGGQVAERVELAYSRLKRDMMDAFQLSLTLESPIEETIYRIKRKFPTSRSLKHPPNALRSVREADVTDLNKYRLAKKVSLTTGTVDQDTWDDMVDDYTSDELPASVYKRSPTDKMLFFSVDEDGSVDMTQRYEWEIEKEMTEDFVSSVRAGEVDAANQNGISDFMWLAIIDKRTDECCAVRDGLSSKEIEDKLESGGISHECDAIAPPAHFNCRCRAVPMSQDLPDENPPDFGSFSDWLDSQGQENAA